MADKRQITDGEKQVIRAQQIGSDGSLRCSISGEIINGGDDIEYDHILPFSKDGETSPANIRIVLKKYNRRKSDQSLYDVRDNIRLERTQGHREEEYPRGAK
jgi:5-methylcytosine-specific restriction endonuclease McrA